MKKLLSVILALVLTAAFLPATQAQTQPLTFRADGTFRILQLSDSQDDAYPAWDMLNLIRTAVKFADPDLIVRTGGEMRISNFLLWQSSYAEYYSDPCYWPDFDGTRLQKAIDAYACRVRKFGGNQK